MPHDQSTLDKVALLKRLVLCHADIQTSLSAITFLNEETDSSQTYDTVELRRLKCFETTFIVAYGRAFTDSKGDRYTRLSLKKIGLKLTEQQQALHDRILEMRQKKVAHSDLSEAHARIDLHSIERKEEQFLFPHVQWDEGLNFVDSDEIYQIMELQTAMLSDLFEKTRSLAIELQDHLPIYMQPIAQN